MIISFLWVANKTYDNWPSFLLPPRPHGCRPSCNKPRLTLVAPLAPLEAKGRGSFRVVVKNMRIWRMNTGIFPICWSSLVMLHRFDVANGFHVLDRWLPHYTLEIEWKWCEQRGHWDFANQQCVLKEKQKYLANHPKFPEKQGLYYKILSIILDRGAKTTQYGENNQARAKMYCI